MLWLWIKWVFGKYLPCNNDTQNHIALGDFNIDLIDGEDYCHIIDTLDKDYYWWWIFSLL